MRNQNVDWEDSYNYSPNELTELSINNPRLYREVIESNLSADDTVENWQQRNLEWAKKCLEEQHRHRR
jgi:hypothetical protein